VTGGSDAETAALLALSAAYASAADAADGPGFAAAFTDDGELWVPDRSGGAAPVLAARGTLRLAQVPSGLLRYHATRHEVLGAELAVDGDLATGSITGVAHHLVAPDGAPSGAAGEGPGTDVVWHLRYDDRYRRTPAGWRIALRTLHVRQVEERRVDRLGPARPTPPNLAP
jgi:hypothetical protein